MAKRRGSSRSTPQGLRIRHVEPSDYVGFAASMATPRAQGGTLQMPLGPNEYWRERLARPDPNAVVLVAEVPRDKAGTAWDIVANAGLHAAGTSPRRRHVMSVGMAVRDDFQGRGVGAALMKALVDRADNWMNVLRIELTVYTDNTPAIALYERFGFVVEGTHRAYALRDGVLVDAYAMARLHPAQPLLPATSKN